VILTKEVLEKQEIPVGKMIRDFMVMVAQDAPNEPLNELEDKIVQLREKLVTEESLETIHALSAKVVDRAELADGLCDMIYVFVGTAIAYGVCIHTLRPIQEDEHNFRGQKAITCIQLICKVLSELVAELRGNGSRSCGLAVSSAVSVFMAYCRSIAIEFDIPLATCFMEVHNSNMAKRWKDGTVLKRNDGKVAKPPGWVGPSLAYVLEHGKTTDRTLYTGLTPEGPAPEGYHYIKGTPAE
jgi:predicted HAD superfamily Cof-like phosphohydrolase